MKYITSILLVIFVNWCCISAEWMIINGTQAIMHEYPQLVSIKFEDFHHCGGTLLNGNTVLTAAHCVYDIKNWSRDDFDYYNMNVVLGEYDLDKMYGVEKVFKITRIIVHDSYDNEMAYLYGNDVALIKFDGFVSNTQYDYIKYSLLDVNSMTEPGQRCEVVGWGSMSPSGNGGARFLQKAYINVILIYS